MTKPNWLPKDDCMYQGMATCKCCKGYVVCDEVGDVCSPEFCKLCAHISKSGKFKPYKVAGKLVKAIMELSDEKRNQRLLGKKEVKE